MKNCNILDHDFGYGKTFDKLEINKLNLKNLNELKIYIEDILLTQYIGLDTNVIKFKKIK